MYQESAGTRSTMGDVDVIYHDGLYHLFHLVLPNHDFIAHAISDDGFRWRRVDNALFIGHPGSWDDSMLWTMHVSRDPHRRGGWRMFYTGLGRRDHGLFQRIGMAKSDDLFRWTKSPVSWPARRAELLGFARGCEITSAVHDPDSCFPLQPSSEYYEASLEEARRWVSWRDPFYFRERDRGWLLCSGRVNQGPIVRRGCVAMMEEVAPDRFEPRPPLHHPGLYDDIEVPNLLQLDGEYFLVGSLREDAKIRYWHTGDMTAPWQTYYDNVLLPQGNYAGRICRDEHGYLIWNFFTTDVLQRTVHNIMPPPKRLARFTSGQLQTTSFEGFDGRVKRQGDVAAIRPVQQNRVAHQDPPHEGCDWQGENLHLKSRSGFRVFAFDERVDSFRFRAFIRLGGLGKCGVVFRFNRDTFDGYYLSLDLAKGVAQMRAWGADHTAFGEQMMKFFSLQAGYWYSETPGQAKIELLAFGSYLEVSVDGRVVLSLADQVYDAGALGFYTETAELNVSDVQLEHLRSPSQSDEHLPMG